MKQLVIFVAIACVLTACGVNIYGKSARYRYESSDPIEVVMPANALLISQQFDVPQARDDPMHEGMDIWGERGTPVLAAASGRVIASYHEPLYGRRIHIDHGPMKMVGELCRDISILTKGWSKSATG